MSDTSPIPTPKTSRMVMTPRVRQALAAAPSQPAGWTYLLSATGTSSAPMVANIRWAQPDVGAQVIVWPLEPNSSNELWMITGDGYIISPLGGANLCLTVSGGNVITGEVTVFGDTTQLWSLADNGTIVSRADNSVLTVGDNGFLGVMALDPSLPPSQVWSCYPGNPLTPILTQAPVPFPTAAVGSGPANAYEAMMLQLGGPGFDLRPQYLNLAAPLAAWLATILTMPCPSDVDATDWATAQQQLAKELTAATAVQALFANYTACHLALFSSQEAILNKAIVDAGIDTNTTTHSLFGVIVWSIVYTVLQTQPETAVVANLIQGGMNVAAAAKSNGVVASNAFSIEVSALWNLLDEGFDEILQGTAVIENDILSDWGRLQAVYAEIIAGSQGNLVWGAAMTAQIVGISAPGFQSAMLQALVPTRYLIFNMPSDESIGNTPPSCQWTWGKRTLVISSASDLNDYPDTMMTNDINPTVLPELFYWGQGGWATPTAYVLVDEYLTLMVTNQTDRFVSFSVPNQPGNPIISPWSSATITWRPDDDAAQIAIRNSSGTALAFFSIAMDKGDAPVVSVQNVGDGWGLTTAVCNPGDDEIYAGSCQITIFMKSQGA